jgi:hypothetical protein
MGRATGIAESVAAAVRRRQQAREPRVILYDSAGEPRVLPPGSEGHDAILATAELLVELATEDAPEDPGEVGEASGESPETLPDGRAEAGPDASEATDSPAARREARPGRHRK